MKIQFIKDHEGQTPGHIIDDVLEVAEKLVELGVAIILKEEKAVYKTKQRKITRKDGSTKEVTKTVVKIPNENGEK